MSRPNDLVWVVSAGVLAAQHVLDFIDFIFVVASLLAIVLSCVTSTVNVLSHVACTWSSACLGAQQS